MTALHNTPPSETQKIAPEQWADIGVNLTDRQFHDDREAVIERAACAGVTWQLITGTTIDDSRAAIALADEHSGLFATAGLHPHSARFYSAALEAELRDLLAHEQIKAAGEMGLDFNRDFSPRPEQERAFEAQLALAAEYKLPVFLHERDAHERFLPILKSFRDALPGAVVHCFTGSREALFAYLDLDCHIGITGWVCDERRGKPLAELLPNISDNRLLLETDAPYLLPRDLPQAPPKKRRNEPALLPWIGQRVAQLRGQETQQVAAMTYQNALTLFR
ncbi:MULTISPECIES: TatD family hydrolase [unclassified Alcanivorax]|jgi:TatD DNase family protein|uniref:TatD family hydrolase n=1 Tax=unclassified Alcanivorax TaxID=2638842 RepID=UPI001E32C103|nr:MULTISPECIES: TatD family hydrolase [unclassified Alcanivorax]